MSNCTFDVRGQSVRDVREPLGADESSVEMRVQRGLPTVVLLCFWRTVFGEGSAEVWWEERQLRLPEVPVTLSDSNYDEESNLNRPQLADRLPMLVSNAARPHYNRAPISRYEEDLIDPNQSDDVNSSSNVRAHLQTNGRRHRGNSRRHHNRYWSPSGRIRNLRSHKKATSTDERAGLLDLYTAKVHRLPGSENNPLQSAALTMDQNRSRSRLSAPTGAQTAQHEIINTLNDDSVSTNESYVLNDGVVGDESDQLIVIMNSGSNQRRRQEGTRKKGASQGSSDEEIEVKDPCVQWMNCPSERLLVYVARLNQLPACPCVYPFGLSSSTHSGYQQEIWDDNQNTYFRWRDASGPAEKLKIYRPGSSWCIRSVVASGSESLASQQCCYDAYRKLVTRGSGAGLPSVVSPDVDRNLHYKVDMVPWLLCKGDFSRYQQRRPPNNNRVCKKNPNERIYQKQLLNAKDY